MSSVRAAIRAGDEIRRPQTRVVFRSGPRRLRRVPAPARSAGGGRPRAAKRQRNGEHCPNHRRSIRSARRASCCRRHPARRRSTIARRPHRSRRRPSATRPRRRHDPSRRRRSRRHAGPRRHARPRQRAGTHRVGRLRTATAAAAAGGITTIVDMPLNSVPATTDAAGARRASARAARRGDVERGVLGRRGARQRRRARRAGGRRRPRLQVLPLAVGRGRVPARRRGGPAPRAADPRAARRCRCWCTRSGRRRCSRSSPPAIRAPTRRGSHSRPPARGSRRDRAADRRSAASTARTIHIVHLAALEALPLLRAARAEGLPITVETCPHYLTFCAEEIADGATLYKCAPPIRGGANRDALWRALEDGDIDLVATDHSPCPPALKADGDFVRAWGGIAVARAQPAGGLDRRVGARRAARAPGGVAVARRRRGSPASTARKGSIAAGKDADLVVWDPDAEFVVDERRLRQRHKRTPYDGLHAARPGDRDLRARPPRVS